MIEIKGDTARVRQRDGTIKEWRIYFRFRDGKRKKDFYFLYEEGDPDSLVLMATSDGKTPLDVSAEEMAEAEETLKAYENDPRLR